MSEILVKFDVPDWVREGLENGTLERIGGVIRDQEGRKSVRAWLREGELLDAIHPSAELREQMGRLMMQNNALLGLSVVNLGVNIAGFALMYRKLAAVENQLNRVAAGIDQVAQSVDWLHVKDLMRGVSRIAAAMKVLGEAVRYRHPGLAREAMLLGQKDLLEAELYFRGVLDSAMERGLELARLEEFAASYRAWITAASGRVEVLLTLGETDLAQAVAAGLRQDHARFGERFRETVGDPYRHLGRNAEARSLLGEVLTRIEAVHDNIRGHTYYLESGYADRAPSAEEQKTLAGHGRLALYVVDAA